MQYFTALKMGEKRVRAAQEIENLIAVKNESNGYLIAICDKNGIAKSISQWFTEPDMNRIISRIKTEKKLEEYFGKLSLPV